jgi:nitrate/nitrite transporter NarK
MNWNSISFQIERYGRAAITAIAFVVLLTVMTALMSWAKSLNPFWYGLLVAVTVAVVSGAGIAFFFNRAPKNF